MDYQRLITIEPGKMGGKPCIRGMRITVYDVLDYLASEMSEEQILADYVVTSLDGYTPFVAGAVPEPATWVMMILGFGAIGAALRVRGRKLAAKFA